MGSPTDEDEGPGPTSNTDQITFCDLGLTGTPEVSLTVAGANLGTLVPPAAVPAGAASTGGGGDA
jgi:hypothetical protein